MSVDLLPGFMNLARHVNSALKFNIIEIGALPIEGESEPFHQLLDLCPGSMVHAFEVDAELCEKLNRSARRGMAFHPVALGRTEERRDFYLTQHPMCASLYRPNERLLERYNNLEVARLRAVESITTTSLDRFSAEQNIGAVDFIKIDVQGAELEVFQGAEVALKDVVAIVSEVEFVQFYEQQPLFGDVCAYLTGRGFMFHKFLTLAGRALKPTIVGGNPNAATQHMWGDVMFLRNTMALEGLTSDQLLKQAAMALIYYSVDVCMACLIEHDRRYGTALYKDMNQVVRNAAPQPGAAGAARARPAEVNPKIERNKPCPCGSGKKYKHCHGAGVAR